MSKGGHIPVRMCIGCHRRRRREELLRFVENAQGFVLVTGKEKVRGRSLYLCPDTDCLKKAQKKRGIPSFPAGNIKRFL